MNERIIILVFVLMYSVIAGEVEIKGKVRDVNTYSVIPLVNIKVQGVSEGTTSGSDGTFIMTVHDPTDSTILSFEHVAFHPLQIKLLDALETDDFHLRPKIILSPKITVEAQREKLDIDKDIPQSIALVEAKRFEVQGYVDAGDLLKTD